MSLFSYPSFINSKEQTPSEILYNNILIVLQTSLNEIWYDVNFGSNLHSYLKQGITPILIYEIQNEIENNIITYFGDQVKLNYLDIKQNLNTVEVDLNYTELQTGKCNTIKTEQTIIDNKITQ